MNFIALDYLDILLASLAIAVNAGLSIGMRLGLEQRLIIAAVRMVAQLTLVGLVLKVLFSLASPVLTGFAILVMILFAGLRERLEAADVPAPFKGPAIALVTAGLMSMAFVGFAGLFRN